MQYITNLFSRSNTTEQKTTNTPPATEDPSKGMAGAALQLNCEDILFNSGEETTGESICRIEPLRELNKFRFLIPKNTDIFTKPYLHIRLKPSSGCIWKQYWPLKVIKSSRLEIGHSEIYCDTNESIAIRCLSKTDDTTKFTDDENLFNFESQERHMRSSRPVEACIPLSSFDIELWRLKHHTVEYVMELNSLKDIIEPNDLVADEIINQSIESIELHGTCRALSAKAKENVIRNHLAKVKFRSLFDPVSITESTISNLDPTGEVYFFNCIKYYNTTGPRVFSSNNCTRTQVVCIQSGYATHAYLWIRKPDHSELPFPTIKSISVVTDGKVKQRLTGHEARTQRSNIYEIDFRNSIIEEDGFEHCLNIGGFKCYMFEIEWEHTVSDEIDITIVHHVQNSFIISAGMGGNLMCCEDNPRLLTVGEYKEETEIKDSSKDTSNIPSN
jgi:hypothetical protein